jgi:hypothetical protein
MALGMACTKDPADQAEGRAIKMETISEQEPTSLQKLYPLDESNLDPSFVDFRTKLAEAIQRRDLEFVLKIAHPEITLGSPEDFPNPQDSLKKMFGPAKYETDMWRELRDMISLGAVRTYGKFCAPYLYTRFPEELDPFEYLVITEENVRVRAEPKSTAPVVARLSYDIVKRRWQGYSAVYESINGEEYPWWRIETPSGRIGYVWGRYARSPLDYEVCFEKVNGRWMMTSLVGHWE